MPPIIADLSDVSSSARGATTINVTLSNYNVGDLLMFHVSYRWDGSDATAQPLAGWSQEVIESFGVITAVSTYWKIADGTEGSAVTVTFLDGPRGGLARCRTITGFNTVTPFSHAGPASGSRIEICEASPVGPGSLAIVAGIIGGGSSVQTPTWPAGWTDDYHDFAPGTIRSDVVGGNQQVDSDVAAGQWITDFANNNGYAATTMIISGDSVALPKPALVNGGLVNSGRTNRGI